MEINGRDNGYTMGKRRFQIKVSAQQMPGTEGIDGLVDIERGGNLQKEGLLHGNSSNTLATPPSPQQSARQF